MTKIVATLGPASNTKEKITDLAIAGANVFRLNFSHGSHKDHAAVHRAVREVSAELGLHLGILADLQGPKLRIGEVTPGGLQLTTGDNLRFTPDENENENGNGADIPLPHPEVFAAIKAGERILVDDGRIRLKVTRASSKLIEAEVLNAATLTSRKGLSFPDTHLDLPPTTPKDAVDLKFALKLGVDWIAMSFVQTADDIRNLRAMIDGPTRIIAKIEKPLAIQNIDAILDQADAIMVARGDLGVECDWHALPAIQASLVSKARAAGKPLIVATQMLESMITSAMPTRAETSDVAQAVTQQVDAVMLSAESAAGAYPTQAVAAMSAIIRSTEATRPTPNFNPDPAFAQTNDSNAIAWSAGILAQTRQARCILCNTETGATAIRVAMVRSTVPVLALCASEDIALALSLVWGVTSLVSTDKSEFDQSREGRLPKRFAQSANVKRGEPVIVTSGSEYGVSGSTDALRITYLA